jgi:hypothetical protein
MKTKDLIELLASHAEALNRGQDTTAALLTYNSGDAAELAPMLWLARSLKTAMEPATPSAAFKASLHQQLLQGRLAPAEVRRPILWIGAAAVGSLLSVAGLALWLLRRPRSHPQPHPATA